MKIAIISDIHGNLAAFEAVLEHIDSLGISQIYCAGDFIDPFKESIDVWNILEERKIPTLRGNHEDYIANYFLGPQAKSEWLMFNHSAVEQLAEYMGKQRAVKLSALPFDMEIKFQDGELLYLCHASFDCNYQSHLDLFTHERKQFFREHPASLFVSGHKHFHDISYLEGNQLAIIGSLGMPLNQDNRAQYITVERNAGQWNVQHHRVNYPVGLTVERFAQDDWMIQAGGMGVLMAEQLLSAEDRLSPFIHWLKSKQVQAPREPAGWTRFAIEYLCQENALAQLRESLPTSYFQKLEID